MRLLYGITLILAACSISYELLIAHTLSLLAANTVVWYSLTIGIYLGAMGAGALFLDKILGRRNTWKLLLYIELGLVLSGGFAIFVVTFSQMLHTFLLLNQWFIPAAIVFPLLSIAMIILIGFLTGIELPLLMTIARNTGGSTNKILGYDYFGSLLGALAIPLLLLPFFEDVLIGLFIAFLNLLVALYILFRILETKTLTFKQVGTAGVLSALLLIAIIYSDATNQYFLKKYYYYFESAQNFNSFISPLDHLPKIERLRSAYQKIDIFQLPQREYPQPLIDAYSTKFKTNPKYPRNYYLFLNGDYQVLSDVDDIYHEWFAHIPIMIQGNVPKNILILGGGDGILNKELLKYADVQNITHVDIDPVLLNAARSHPVLTLMNEHAFEDSRVNVIIEDAFVFVKNATATYDAVYIDFPFARDYTLSRLFSREFYSFVKDLVTSDGYVVIDAPDSEFYVQETESGQFTYQAGESWEVYYHTMKTAGFETIVPYTSLLEADNEEALAIITSLMQEARGEDDVELRSQKSRQVLENYVQSTAQGFILLKKNSIIIDPAYKDFGVPFSVLNERRFDLSLNLPYPKPPDIDWNKVNSIMQPIVLGSPVWKVRRPY